MDLRHHCLKLEYVKIMFFSITIPAYKKKYLKEAIDSCLAQSYKDFELVIVNDHSPEDLDSIVKSYNDSRIRYYVNKKNCGAINVVDNWNKCLEYAKGDYIICMGDDDRLLPCCLREYSKLIEKYPKLKVYHAWTQMIDDNGEMYMYQESRPEYEGAYALLWHRWLFRNWQFIGDFCFSTDNLRAQGGFFKLPLAWSSDDITVFRAALQGGIANTQIPCFQYRSNAQTISSNGNSEMKIKALSDAKKWYLNELKEYKGMIGTEVENTERNFYYLLSKAIVSYYRKRFFWTFNEALASKNWCLHFWKRTAPDFFVSPHDVVKEVYNYYMKKFFHIGNSY